MAEHKLCAAAAAAAYTVGWICVLPVERSAARVILDKEHLLHDGVGSTQYTLGRIGSHNIALACLPAGQIGRGAAAFNVGQVTARYTSICFGLVEGRRWREPECRGRRVTG